MINKHEEEIRNKVSFYGNDLLLNAFDNIKTNFTNANYITDKDFNYNNLKKEIKIDKQETDVILTFGTNLGITDRETQLSNIDECINDIQEVILKLKEEKNNKCKLYKCLGTFSGILIAVLLI